MKKKTSIQRHDRDCSLCLSSTRYGPPRRGRPLYQIAEVSALALYTQNISEMKTESEKWRSQTKLRTFFIDDVLPIVFENFVE
jgi:hypothetical protein